MQKLVTGMSTCIDEANLDSVGVQDSWNARTVWRMHKARLGLALKESQCHVNYSHVNYSELTEILNNNIF